MAFWGVEVTPEKPYIHLYSADEGTLHVSQATLGAGTSTKKSILQCSVGSKRPIYLCSLLPDKLETCALNLEFEEDEEVRFSVIGQHSIYLSGYFVGDCGDEDECGEEDECDSDGCEGHFGESESESDESIYYDSEDEDDVSLDDDDLDMIPPPPVRPSGVKIEEIFDDEKPADESGLSKQKKKKKHQKNDLNDNNNSEKQIVVKGSHQVPVLESEDEDGFPVSGKSIDKESKESKGDDAPGKQDAIDLGCEKQSKRKIDAVSQDSEHSRGLVQAGDHSTKTMEVNSEYGTKRGKKNKKKKVVNEEEILPDANSKYSSSQVENLGNTEETKGKENLKEKKKKKKKKRETENGAGSNAKETTVEKRVSTVDDETKNEAKPFQVRSFPNGLVIEELAIGRPDGKRAAPGKKVSVRYVGKLKKNGKIFDSNIGKAPFKFRLGIGQVIKGWDVGVNGMRVGDKRRLTIPPSMGYGAEGAGNAIPPNSWLVFDVELVDVN